MSNISNDDDDQPTFTYFIECGEVLKKSFQYHNRRSAPGVSFNVRGTDIPWLEFCSKCDKMETVRLIERNPFRREIEAWQKRIEQAMQA